MKTQNGLTNKTVEAVITKNQHKLIAPINKATVALNKLEPFNTINVQHTQNSGLI